MKQNLLILIFSLSSLLAFGQFAPDGSNEYDGFFENDPTEQPEIKVTIYPNPATDFISVSNEDKVSEIVIYNLVGRKIKTFEVESGARYNISDLVEGMYLIQILNHAKKVITTQRISKR